MTFERLISLWSEVLYDWIFGSLYLRRLEPRKWATACLGQNLPVPTPFSTTSKRSVKLCKERHWQPLVVSENVVMWNSTLNNHWVRSSWQYQVNQNGIWWFFSYIAVYQLKTLLQMCLFVCLFRLLDKQIRTVIHQLHATFTHIQLFQYGSTFVAISLGVLTRKTAGICCTLKDIF